jgi:predicted ATPase
MARRPREQVAKGRVPTRHKQLVREPRPESPPLRQGLHNLPNQPTSFIGRGREITDIKRLLGETGLLTLIGPGGIAKSRLALEAATALLEEYPDGARLVDLAPLSDPALVPGTVASALGVTEQPGRSVAATLAEFLRARAILVVLDNCEHLLAACGALTENLLRASSRLRILATSREALGIAAETRWRVPPLSLPGSHRALACDQLLNFEAVRLFEDRGKAADPNFSVTHHNTHVIEEMHSSRRHSAGHRTGGALDQSAHGGGDRLALA